MRIFLYFIALSVLLTGSSSVLAPSIVGTWKYVSKDGKLNYVRFSENNDYYYLKNGERIAGEPFIKYTYYTDKDPAQIDLKGYGLSGDKIFVWEGIVRMVDKKNMAILIRDGEGLRPRSFEDTVNAELILFQRISK